ncbi:MAG: hypothetical protein ACXAEX_22955 [Promethearchaeota archaeon]|jgi:hypothetical protein
MRSLYEMLSEIREEQKCRNCICLLEILKLVSRVDNLCTHNRHEFSKWIEEMNENDIHDCLGCNPCLPVEAYNLFSNVSSDSEV